MLQVPCRSYYFSAVRAKADTVYFCMDYVRLANVWRVSDMHRPTPLHVTGYHYSDSSVTTFFCLATQRLIATTPPLCFQPLNSFPHPFLVLTTPLCNWDHISMPMFVNYNQAKHLHDVCSFIYIYVTCCFPRPTAV